ncbi:hypothetical protein H0W32_01560, partial [Patescibacteria group bacterium]|nr:hypothetical protein [Patescibacteria group bacterium]
NIPDIKYQISLVGEYEDQLPTVFYNTKSYGPVFLKTGEQNKLVEFSYPLPMTFSGKNLGIHVRAVSGSGEPLAWADTRVAVTGGLSVVNTSNVQLSVDGKVFRTSVGPMVYKDKKATIDVTLTNPSTSNLELTPHISLFDRSISGRSIKSYNEPTVSLAAGSKVTVSYDLPQNENKAGVYVGELTFVDSTNIVRAIPINFRYIIAGDIVTITSLTSQKTSVQKDELINLTLNYTGTPYDIETLETPGNATAEVDVKVFNEYDKAVGVYKETMNFNEGTSKSIVLKASDKADAMRANVVVKKNDVIIAQYSTDLSPNYNEAKEIAKNNPLSTQKINIWYILLPVFLIILIIGFMFLRKKMLGRNVSLVIVGMLIAGGIFATGIKSTHAFTITSSVSHGKIWNYNWDNPTPNKNVGTHGYHPFTSTKPWFHTYTQPGTLVPSVNVTAPVNNKTMSPGQSFYVNGTVYAQACINTPQTVIIKVTFQGKTISKTYDNINDADASNKDHSVSNQDFSIGPFNAPTGSGPYKVIINVINYTNTPNINANVRDRNASVNKATPATWDTRGGVVEGYQTIIVNAPAPTVSLNANPTTIASGGTSKLTWTSQNATSCTSTDFATGNNPTNSVGVSTGVLTGTKTYTIKCTGPGGVATDPAVVTVTDAPAPPKVTLTATPNRVPYGTNSNLKWTSTNATSCTSSDFATANATNNTTGVSTGNLTAAKTFTITCTGSGGSTPSSATVNVDSQPLPPTVTLTADPTAITTGGSSDLTWTSQNATSCTGTGFNANGATSNAVGVSTGSLNATKAYRIDCSGPGGNAYDTETVTVNGGVGPVSVSVSLTAEDYSIPRGSSPLLKWTSSNATTCTSSDFTTSGATNNSIGVSTGNINSSKTYTITCSNSGDTASDSVTVNVEDTTITSTCRAETVSGAAISQAAKGTLVYWRIVSPPLNVQSYSWSGTEITTPYTTSSFSKTYATNGVKSVTLTLSLTDGTVKDINCQTLIVKDGPTFIEI